MPRLLLLIFIFAVLAGCNANPNSITNSPTATPYQFPATFTPAPPTATLVAPPVTTHTPVSTSTLTEGQAVIQLTSFARQSVTPTPDTSAIPLFYAEILALTASPTPPVIPRLAKHEWTTEPILVEYGWICGGGCTYPTGQVTELILYNTGLLIRRGDGLQFRHLPENNICRALNTIDQAGYFVYDKSVYRETLLGAGGSLYINVNSWQTRFDSWYGISDFLDPETYQSYAANAEGCVSGWCEVPPIILQPIRDTFRFLESFDPKGWKPYTPTRYFLALQRGFEPTERDQILKWPDDLPKPSTLFEEIADGQSDARITLLLEGEYAQNWTIDTPIAFVQSENEWFLLQSQPLFPFQEERADRVLGRPDSKYLATFEGISLSCEPGDGVYPIPTP